MNLISIIIIPPVCRIRTLECLLLREKMEFPFVRPCVKHNDLVPCVRLCSRLFRLSSRACTQSTLIHTPAHSRAANITQTHAPMHCNGPHRRTHTQDSSEAAMAGADSHRQAGGQAASPLLICGLMMKIP